MVRERRGAPGGGHAENVRVLASQVVLDSALVESFNRVLLSGRSLVFSYPTVHTQQSSVPNGVAEHNVTERRGLPDPLAGQPGAPIGQAGGQPPGVSDAAGQPAVPSQPHEGSLGALPLPLALAGTYDDTVRNIDTTQRHLGHALGGKAGNEAVAQVAHAADVSTRLGDLARFTFKGLDGTMTDLFIHLVAYQLVTLSGTGVSVLD